MFPPMTPPPFGWNGPDDDPRDGPTQGVTSVTDWRKKSANTLAG